MPRLTSIELEQEITQQFLFGHNVKYLSEFYNIPMLRIHRILKRNGINKIPKNMLDVTLDDEKRICELYEKGFSTCDIANVYFKDKIKCDRTVANILRKNNIKLREFGAENKVFNSNFFETIDTEYKAYWLGFIYADGNIRISKNNTHVLQIELEQTDGYLLEKLVDLLQYKEKIKNYESEIIEYVPKTLNYFERENRFDNYSKLYKGCSLQVHSKTIYDSLVNHGVTPQKTLKICLPKNIPNDLLKHFVRGYFDADSSCTSHKIIFYGQHNLLEFIKDILLSLGVNDNKIFDKPNENVSMLAYSSKKDLVTLYNYFYKDSHIYMKRKKEKILTYVGTEVTN